MNGSVQHGQPAAYIHTLHWPDTESNTIRYAIRQRDTTRDCIINEPTLLQPQRITQRGGCVDTDPLPSRCSLA